MLLSTQFQITKQLASSKGAIIERNWRIEMTEIWLKFFPSQRWMDTKSLMARSFSVQSVNKWAQSRDWSIGGPFKFRLIDCMLRVAMHCMRPTHLRMDYRPPPSITHDNKNDFPKFSFGVLSG